MAKELIRKHLDSRTFCRACLKASLFTDEAFDPPPTASSKAFLFTSRSALSFFNKAMASFSWSFVASPAFTAALSALTLLPWSSATACASRTSFSTWSRSTPIPSSSSSSSSLSLSVSGRSAPASLFPLAVNPRKISNFEAIRRLREKAFRLQGRRGGEEGSRLNVG